jgi:hypothetical protein
MDNQANPASERSSEDPMIKVGKAGCGENEMKQQLAFPRPRVGRESALVMPAPHPSARLHAKRNCGVGEKIIPPATATMLAVIS